MSSKLAHHIYRSICHQNLTDWPNVSKKDRKSTRLNSSHSQISYAVFCLKKKKNKRCRCCRRPPSKGHAYGDFDTCSWCSHRNPAVADTVQAHSRATRPCLTLFLSEASH